VVFFYTHAIHRSPPPPTAEQDERYTMFGTTYGQDGKSEGELILRENYEDK